MYVGLAMINSIGRFVSNYSLNVCRLACFQISGRRLILNDHSWIDRLSIFSFLLVN